jgi:hypothetical protein
LEQVIDLLSQECSPKGLPPKRAPSTKGHSHSPAFKRNRQAAIQSRLTEPACVILVVSLLALLASAFPNGFWRVRFPESVSVLSGMMALASASVLGMARLGNSWVELNGKLFRRHAGLFAESQRYLIFGCSLVMMGSMVVIWCYASRQGTVANWPSQLAYPRIVLGLVMLSLGVLCGSLHVLLKNVSSAETNPNDR